MKKFFKYIADYFQRLIPTKESLRKNKWLNSFFGRFLFHPKMWRFNNPYCVAGGIAVGIFCSLSPPVGTQIWGVIILANILRVNLPLGLAIAIGTNVLTNLPFFYLFILLGRYVRGINGAELIRMSDINLEFIKSQLLSFCVGFAILAPIITAVVYIVSYYIAKNIRLTRIREFIHKRRQRKLNSTK